MLDPKKFLLIALVSLSFLAGSASALSWCEDKGGQTQVTQRATTQSTNVFEAYAECAFDSASRVYSCTDYCATDATLAKFHCSLHQPGAVRLAKRDYVDCKARGYAGCSNGACVAKMPAARPSPSPSPSPKPRAWCGAVGTISDSAPKGVSGARSDGSVYAFTDYCDGAKTLAHYSCSGAYYRVELNACANGCGGGVCLLKPALKAPERESDAGVWLAYAVIGVLLVAGGVGAWLYFSGAKTGSKRKSDKKSVGFVPKPPLKPSVGVKKFEFK